MTAVQSTKIVLREMHSSDALSFIEVQRSAVRGLAAGDYSRAIIDEWAPMPITSDCVQSVAENAENEYRLLAELNGVVVGVGSIIVRNEELRACYVAPEASRLGVGAALLSELERVGRERGVKSLHLDSSLTAAPFYAARGYRVRENGVHVLHSGLRMACVKMAKALVPSTGNCGAGFSAESSVAKGGQ